MTLTALCSNILLDISIKNTSITSFYYNNPIAFETPYFKGYIFGLTQCQETIKSVYNEFLKDKKLSNEYIDLFFIKTKNALIELKKNNLTSWEKKIFCFFPYRKYGLNCSINKSLKILNKNYKDFINQKGIYERI